MLLCIKCKDYMVDDVANMCTVCYQICKCYEDYSSIMKNMSDTREELIRHELKRRSYNKPDVWHRIGIGISVGDII